MNTTTLTTIAALLLSSLSQPFSSAQQAPVGPQRPEMPAGEPEIVINNNQGLRIEPDPNNPDETRIIYLGDVRLVHRGQNLDLKCDRLELYFSDAGDPQAEGQDQAAEPEADQPVEALEFEPVPASPIRAEDPEVIELPINGGDPIYQENLTQNTPAEAAPTQASNIQRIIAIGNVEIVKEGDDGTVNIARCGHAIYYPDSGNALLTRAPQVQDATRLVRATGDQGTIELREDGSHEARDGEFQTILTEGAN